MAKKKNNVFKRLAKMKELWDATKEEIEEDEEEDVEDIDLDEDDEQEEEDKNPSEDDDVDEDFDDKEEEPDFDIDEDDQDEDEDIDSKNGLHISNLKLNKKSIALLAGATIILGCGIVSCSHKSKKSDENTSTATIEQEQDTDEITEEITTVDEFYGDSNNYDGFSDILDHSNINEDKKKVLSKVWSYLSYYNTVVADENKDTNSTAKLAFTWDEAVAQYLAYNINDLSDDMIKNVFDGYVISSEELLNSYESSYRMDLDAAHVVLYDTGKKDLLTDEQKINYDKYEDMINSFNNCSNTEDGYYLKKSVVDSFYSELRKDYINGNTSVQARMPIIPLVAAMSTMSKSIDSEYKLLEVEKNSFLDRDARVKEANSIFDRVSSVAIGTDLNEEFSYSELRDLAIEELRSINAYNIENRDIIAYTKYQESLSPMIPEITEEPTTEVVDDEDELIIDDGEEQLTEPIQNEESTTESSKKEKKQKKETKEVTTELDDDDKSDTIPDWMLDDDTTSKKKKKKSKKNKTTKVDSEATTQDVPATTEQFIDEDVPEVDKDTPDYSQKSNQGFQNYCDMLASMIVDNMSKEIIIDTSKQLTKHL